ncbi:glycine receptor subunit alpha-3-like protein, partial [Dinothrombium tinctorium]
AEVLLNMDDVFPKEYDNLHPPKTNGNPTVVSFHVWVLSIDSIDEGSMTYTADIFMSQIWKDDRLNIPDDATDNKTNYRLLPLSWLEKMWRPDSFFKNAKQVTFQEMTIPNHYIWLYSDKRILYMVK